VIFFFRIGVCDFFFRIGVCDSGMAFPRILYAAGSPRVTDWDPAQVRHTPATYTVDPQDSTVGSLTTPDMIGPHVIHIC
jgi:hypothetical protein